MTTVLIVDDQASFRRQLRQLLAAAGLVVIAEAGNIAAALPLAKNLQPDLAIVDLMLPGVSGIQGVTSLKSVAPKMRVIIVSIYHDQAGLFRSAARQAGAEAFIPKDDLDPQTVRDWINI